MTGYLRFVLAFLVVANHLWQPVANQVGLHAVETPRHFSEYESALASKCCQLTGIE
jgi:hypothetical protein